MKFLILQSRIKCAWVDIPVQFSGFYPQLPVLSTSLHNRETENRVSNVHILYFFFCNRQLHFSSELGVANEILENEAKSCLTVA